MQKTFMGVMSAVALFLVTTTAGAAESRARLIKTVFYSETGEKSEFNATEGGAIRITQLDKHKEYRLVPEFVGDEVRFKIYDAASGQLLDTLDMSGRGVIKNSIVVPFSLSVEGIEETAEQTSSRVGGAAPLPQGLSCCVVCGRYQLCCEPRRGYCCTISSSCGYGCGVCN